jgi:hypothetical protein
MHEGERKMEIERGGGREKQIRWMKEVKGIGRVEQTKTVGKMETLYMCTEQYPHIS